MRVCPMGRLGNASTDRSAAGSFPAVLFDSISSSKRNVENERSDTFEVGLVTIFWRSVGRENVASDSPARATAGAATVARNAVDAASAPARGAKFGDDAARRR